MLLGMSQGQIDQLSKRKVSSSTITFLAPASGVIARIDATEGQYVSEGSPLYRIEKPDKIWVESELYPGESAFVKIGDKINVKLMGLKMFQWKVW